VRNMLLTLGRAEVDGIIAERGEVEVTCEFCNQRYALDAAACDQLFARD
jgi:molecular chaperone Hsp33